MSPRRAPTTNNNTDDNGVPDYMHQLLQGQAQLIQLLPQNMNNNQYPPPPPPPPLPPVDMLARFLRLNPQRFSSTPEPIVAADCLRSLSRYLETAACSEADSFSFSSHLFDGPAAACWSNYLVTSPIATLT